MKNKNKLLGAGVLLLSTCLVPTQVFSMVLEDAIGHAIPTNPDIKSSQAEAKAKEHQIGQEKSGYFPTLDVSTSAGPEYDHQRFKANGLTSTPVTGTASHKRYESTVNLVQPIFSGLDTVNRVQKAKDETLQATRKSEETRTLVAFQAAEAYIAVRRFQRLWRLAQENVEFHKKISSKVKQLVDAGKASSGDLHTTDARLQDSTTAVSDILGDLSTAVSNFINVVGIRPDRLANAKIKDAVLPKSLQEAIDVALEKNRSVILAKQSIKVSETDVQVSQSQYYPNLNIEADARHSQDTAGRKGYEDNAKALLVLRWNLFRGGRDLNRTREYKERTVKAKDDLLKAMRTAEREVRVSWGERVASALQAESLRKAVTAKEQVVATYNANFDLGKASLLDLLDVQNEFFLAKGSLITADATQDLTEARLLAAMGNLEGALGIPEGGKLWESPPITNTDATEKVVQDLVDGAIKMTL